MKHIFMWILLLATSISFSQIKISGTVTDKTTGIGIPSVAIATSSENGTTSDINGVYTIFISDNNQVINLSYLGYKTQKINIGTQRIINVQLEEIETNLDEIVVTALGLNRKTKELGYVVQEINAKEVTNVKTVNFLENLAGKLAGVTISQGATGVGSSSKITIRGEASFSNNNPLFVVDGTPINNNSVFNFTNEAAAGFQEIDFGNGAMEVNPDDIETITVLKGPSAAALYGTRASNGVIVINTKDGSKKTRFRRKY